jgi:hypothetical protein
MCVTKELKHTVCLHTDKYKKECIKKPGSLLSAFVKCSQTVQSSQQYDLCHECRRFWAKHDIREQEATRSYVNYRQAHDHDGPLSPTFMFYMFYADDPVQKRNIDATGESSQTIQNSAGPSAASKKVLQDITPMLYGRPNPERRSSDTSIRTRWPNLFDFRSESMRDACSEKGNGKEVVRNRSNSGTSSPQGVVLLTEDEEGPPKRI